MKNETTNVPHSATEKLATVLDNKFNGVDIKFARLHANLFIQGLGSVGPELSSNQSATFKAVKMTLFSSIVIVEGNGKNGKFTEFVPITSFLQLTPSL